MSNYFYAIKIFYSEDKKNFFNYIITNFLTAPLLIMELIIMRSFINILQNGIHVDNYHNSVKGLLTLILVLYLNSLNSSLKSLSITKLTEIGLYLEEKILLDKTSRLSVLDLNSPVIKDMRANAKKLSIFGLLNQWTNLIVNTSIIVILGILIIYYGYMILFGIITLVLFLQLGIRKILIQRKEKIHYKQTTANRVSEYLFNLLVNKDTIQEIRIYKIKEYLVNKLTKITSTNFKIILNETILSEMLMTLSNSIVAILNGISLILLVIIASRNIDGGVTFIFMIQVLNHTYSTIPNIINDYSSLKSNCIYFLEYKKYLGLHDCELPKNEIKLNKSGISISIKNLTFKYREDDREILKNIDISINSGEKIAFVGENGSGKTTLVKIILGLFKVNKGSVKWYYEGDKNLNRTCKKQCESCFSRFHKTLVNY